MLKSHDNTKFSRYMLLYIFSDTVRSQVTLQRYHKLKSGNFSKFRMTKRFRKLIDRICRELKMMKNHTNMTFQLQNYGIENQFSIICVGQRVGGNLASSIQRPISVLFLPGIHGHKSYAQTGWSRIERFGPDPISDLNLGLDRTRTNKIQKTSDRFRPLGQRTWRSMDPLFLLLIR